jgi:hypothetical protein
MQDRTYSDLQNLIEALAGVSSFTEEEVVNIQYFVNRRMYEAYNRSPVWNRYLVVSELRKLASASIRLSGRASNRTSINGYYELIGSQAADSTLTDLNVYRKIGTTNVFLAQQKYTDSGLSITDANGRWSVGEGTAVEQSDGTYTTSITQSSATYDSNVTPESSLNQVSWYDKAITAADSTLVADFKNLIPFDEANRESINDFIRINRSQAFLNLSTVEYDFYVDEQGANLLNPISSATPVDGVFVTYKKRLFSDEVLSEDNRSGFNTSSTNIPGEFFNYLAHAAYSDFLRMDGQHGKSMKESEIADEFLALELEKVDLMSNNNTINRKFSTYVNRQSR